MLWVSTLGPLCSAWAGSFDLTRPVFYRAKHSVARYCQGKLSVCLSICDVAVSWSYLENIFTAD